MHLTRQYNQSGRQRFANILLPLLTDFWLHVNNFYPDDLYQLKSDVDSVGEEFTRKGVDKLIIDLHHNGNMTSDGSCSEKF